MVTLYNKQIQYIHMNICYITQCYENATKVMSEQDDRKRNHFVLSIDTNAVVHF